MKQKRLYMISLGPGSVHLLTLAALEAFRECEAICVPTKSEDGDFSRSVSYKIVKEALKRIGEDKILIPIYTPMRYMREDWLKEVDAILAALKQHKRVCFVTLGDAAIYSSIYYLLDIIKERAPLVYEACEVIPGVTSFSAASAKIKQPLCLGDEELLLRPINPRSPLRRTQILMRPKVGMDTASLGEGSFYSFENMYLPNERITPSKIKRVASYLTLFIKFAKGARLKIHNKG